MEIEEVKQVLGVEYSFIYDDIIDPVIKRLNVDKESKILDVGTGEGRMAISLALNGYSVITGEPEMDNSEYAKRDWLVSAKKVDVNKLITFKAFNAEEMPFEDDEFDAIFMMGALHHINNKNIAIKECVRITKPGGFFCIIEPNEKGLEIIRKNKTDHPDAIDPRDYLKELPVDILNKNMFVAFIFKKQQKK